MHCSVAIFDQKLEIFINLWHIVLEKLDFIYFFSATKRVVELPLKSSAHIAIESTTIKKSQQEIFFRMIFVCFSSLRLMARFFTSHSHDFFCGLHPWKTNSLHLWATIKTIKKFTYVSSLFISLLVKDEKNCLKNWFSDDWRFFFL